MNWTPTDINQLFMAFAAVMTPLSVGYAAYQANKSKLTEDQVKALIEKHSKENKKEA